MPAMPHAARHAASCFHGLRTATPPARHHATTSPARHADVAQQYHPHTPASLTPPPPGRRAGAEGGGAAIRASGRDA
eukprot:59195-Prymnesium_polylepis.1